jgi:hypothetical protein
LRQLCGLGPNDPPPAQPPKGLDPTKVTHYQEPVYQSVHFLERLGQLREQPEHRLLNDVPAAKDFDIDAWKREVAARAKAIVRPDLSLDEGRLVELLRGNDQLGKLDPVQQAKVDRRIRTEVTQIAKWASVLNQMSISPQDKRTALLQLVENTAANHRANAILFDYLPRAGMDLELDRDKEIDDFYTAADAVMR